MGAFDTPSLVGPGTPPTFLAHSLGDTELPAAEHSDPYHEACAATGVDVEYLREDFGGHGCGLVEAWGRPCMAWLTARGFASPAVGNDYVYDFADGEAAAEAQATVTGLALA